MRRHALVGIIAAMAVLVASWATGVTLGAFSDVTQNPGNTFTAAASFCPTPGSQTVNPDADSYIRQDSPGANYGNAAVLHVQSRNFSRNRRAMLHFPLPAVPANCTVTSATLRMFATTIAVGRTLDVYRVAAPWTELGVTWSNQPATVGGASSTVSSVVGWMQWDVTAQVLAMYAGPNNGFKVRDRTEGGNPLQLHIFNSRQGLINFPELVVTLG